MLGFFFVKKELTKVLLQTIHFLLLRISQWLNLQLNFPRDKGKKKSLRNTSVIFKLKNKNLILLELFFVLQLPITVKKHLGSFQPYHLLLCLVKPCPSENQHPYSMSVSAGTLH